MDVCEMENVYVYTDNYLMYFVYKEHVYEIKRNAVIDIIRVVSTIAHGGYRKYINYTIPPRLIKECKIFAQVISIPKQSPLPR